MPSSRTLSKACLSASRLPNRLSLSLSLQNPTLGISAARSISSSPQNGSSSIMGTVDTFATLAFAPIVGMAWLFEQLDAGGIEG